MDDVTCCIKKNISLVITHCSMHESETCMLAKETILCHEKIRLANKLIFPWIKQHECSVYRKWVYLQC